VKFASGAHGDAYPFDGPGGVLAHTFYPVPVNPETIAGDMHLDADEAWHVGSDIAIYSVALHEAGHAIGLGHSDKPGDVMYPYYRSGMSLSTNDIGAARVLYGIAASAPSPITSGLATPLTLTLSAYPGSVPTAVASTSGTAAGGVAPYSVQWQTDSGSGGSAVVVNPSSTAVLWNATGIPLVVGTNQITVTAYDSARAAASQTIVVPYAPSGVPASPASPISISITVPASVVTRVNTSTISVAGTASGGVSGITKVTWQTGQGLPAKPPGPTTGLPPCRC
jgi:hypothetical protein